MSGQSGGRLHLSTLNEQLTCKLCGGYFIDATTIIECLHSFCKSCIVKYLENNKYCPVCDAQVHKNKPLLNIRPDQTLQDIVYKLVPGCYQNEMRCRKEFYAKHPEDKNSVTSPEARGEPVESYIYSPDESLSLSLEYYSPEVTEELESDKEAASKHLPRRYLRCPAAVTVFHLQKLIRAKYGLSEAHRIDIMYKEEPLCTSYTLMDIMYIYHWRRKVPLHLSYRIFESASKRIKLSEDNDEFKQSLSNSNMELESKDNEQSIKREWKEVQLKISETGVMSVMDISSLDSKKSTKINEINQQSGLDQAASNSYNVNKTVVKAEEKEAVKSCTASSKSKKLQQDSSTKKSEQVHDEKSSNVSLSAISASQSNSKSEEMEVKSIDQRDLSNELMKTENAKNDNCPKAPNDSAQTSSSVDKSQPQKAQQPLEKIKTESASTADKRSEGKQNLTNNNSINNETKAEVNAKPNAKSNDAKGSPSAGSKINALSAKLQFQPKVGQVNNTYSKKSPAVDKKATSTSPGKTTDNKLLKTSLKSEIKPSEGSSSIPVTEPNASKVAVGSVPCSGISSASNLTGVSSVAATYVTAPSTSIDTCATSIKLQQQQHNNALQTVAAPSTESLASIGLHVSTTIPSQMNLNNWITDRSKNSSGKSTMSPDLQLRSLPGMPQIGKDIICSTTASSPASSMGRFNIQTPSMSIYSITTTMKNNVYTSASQSYSNSPSKQVTTKPGFGTSTMYPQVPPCPAAIPISLMKPAKASKGTTLNEICAKISNASSSGSKINDICAKIGESSKEKSKIDAMQQQLQRNKPEVPDLLKISKKTLMTPMNESIHGSNKHIPNIPNVPIYTPSNSQALHASNEAAKDSVNKRLATTLVSSQAALMTPQMQKMSQKKHSQAVGYKTLRDPPKSWNPTLSKNNYVAAKNQAKEMQNQAQAAYGINDGSGAPSKQPASKQAKIFKIRNMPRYLGNPASGVKPMYGVVNEQSKDKDQSTSAKNNSPTMSMMKIDPQTLSPIVSSPNNSPIVSPPPYSPTARSYQNSPFTPRDICRNSNSPISPRNSPVNMLSTNPFIPSQTHNTNPRLIYSHFPPTFTDASRFSNPLIRSPIGISPSSAFHSSLPPSINKFYQRSGYMTQPQTSAAVAAAAAAAAATASFSSGATAQQQQQQPPAAQRIPPSSHSSPMPPASSPSASSPSSASSKSPKTSSASSGGAGAANVKLTTTTTTSTASASVVDSVALQLAKGLTQRDSKVYDLTRTDTPKSSSDNIGATNQNALSSPHSAQAATKNSDVCNKVKSSPSTEVQKTSGETSTKQNDLHTTSKSSQQEAKTAISIAATTAATTTTATKELSRDEKSHAKVNGGITITMMNNDKPKVDAAGSQKQEKVEKPIEDKSSVVDTATEGDKSNSATSPSKHAPNKIVTQEAENIETKQTATVTQQKPQNSEGGKQGDGATTPQGKKIVADAQKGKVES